MTRARCSAGSLVASPKGDLIHRIDNAIGAQAAVWDGRRFRMIPSVFAVFAEGLNNGGEILMNPQGNWRIGKEAASVKGAQALPSSLDEFRPGGTNNRGQIVGSGWLKGAQHDAPYLWSDGKLTDISFGLPDLQPESINDKGQIVGLYYQRLPARTAAKKAKDSIDFPDGRFRGTVYLLNPGARRWERTNLLDGVTAPLNRWDVDELQINDRGRNLGSVFYESGKKMVRYAAVWDQGRVQQIGTSDDWVDPKSMNSAGQVVGRRDNGSGWTPFIWQGGTLYNLNKLVVGKPGIKSEEVHAINNKGWILCDVKAGDQSHAVLLRPVNSRPVATAAANVATRPSP